MSKKIKYILILSFVLSFLVSCFHEDDYSDTNKGNFELLWKILDERYCFFSYKEIDWNQVHDRYAGQVKEEMNQYEFFYLMRDMLNELKDGHVNLVSRFDNARYWAWFEDYPYNFDPNLQQLHYLGKSDEFSIAGGLKYRALLPDSIGYIYCESFSTSFSANNLDYVLYRLRDCKGLIIDVRNNGGGMLNLSEMLAARFFEEKTVVGFIQHKNGKSHDSFSTPYPKEIDPPLNRVMYLTKPVVVLANRRSFSATNDFVNAMKHAKNVVIMGDRTGGGSGLPFSSEIPNGWAVRFSASPMLGADMEQLEFGIDPDYKIDMDTLQATKGIDTIIEEARKYIIDHSRKKNNVY